ncbi:hypothetical protein DPMN_032471 [Dreissena polymorpha]|uniref:Uncharacterized protein n=1 Tax=Dreissena polymorpha TaxID=45954 RepID=A0A9D4RIY5_DREPO|nr:hypothetical protein DPMN_032471 [Dreissena polymorpha]
MWRLGEEMRRPVVEGNMQSIEDVGFRMKTMMVGRRSCWSSAVARFRILQTFIIYSSGECLHS